MTRRNTDEGADDTLTFAHITDAHLTSPAGATLLELCNKRALGYLSWRRRRRHLHRREVLDALVHDLHASDAEHYAVTGDLTHVGLPAECRVASRWLERLGPPERVSLVPGNHDRYVAANWDRTVGLWSDYLASDETVHDGFPSLRERGPVSFIGLSSACPTPPLMATGRLGHAQRQRLVTLLSEAAARRRFRVVLIHHPPVPGSYKWRKRLTDGRATAAALSRYGAELILHGHTHRLTRNVLIRADGGRIPVVGLASASTPGPPPERAARYSLWTVRRAGESFRLTHRSRDYDRASGGFVDDPDWDPLSVD
jgi:3',5'-cyclic AMP phosphodiesterase CpdA